MQIEAVVICKDYGDFLEHTLPENMQHFDRMVVVTHPSDTKTRGLCQRYGVDLVVTECMHEDGDAFNKGRAINLGLGHCRGQEWLLHLDADIVLPHGFRNLLYRAKLRSENLYGADRLNVYGWEKWQELKAERAPHYRDGYFIEPPKGSPVGARILHSEHGYTPIGYFQLWHKNQGKKYPINQGNAEHTDVLFACQWPRHQRVLLPEVICLHLESGKEPGPMGTNWNGRKTPLFGPPHKEHQHNHHKHHHHHCPHHHHHPCPYCPCPHR